MSYEQFLRSEEWVRLRAEVRIRDDWTCRHCDAEADPGEVHHLTYGRGRSCPAEDLVLLCGECHRREHQDELPLHEDEVEDVVSPVSLGDL